MIEMMPCKGEQEAGGSKGLPLLTLGFRPFFLGAAIAGLLLMGAWLWSLLSGHALSRHYGFVGWHAHEMIFGYGVAVIAGFLLTAVHNWTDLPTAHGPKLAALFGLWLAGRLVGLIPPLAGPVTALVDVAFIPALGLVLLGPLRASKQGGNPVFLVFLGILTVANGLVHLEALGWTHGTAAVGQAMGINGILLIVTVIGGRVIPMFTRRAFPDTGVGTVSRPVVKKAAIEKTAIGSLAVLLLAEAVGVPPVAVGVLALLAAASHLIRVIGWHQPGVWRIPLLWVLFCGYGWMLIGLVLKALVMFHLLPLGAATHALAVGAIGVLTLGIMSRVTLGHTGHPMRASTPVIFAFVLLMVTAFARVTLAVLMPVHWQMPMALVGALWMLTFGVFLWVFTPMWLGPEGDED